MPAKSFLAHSAAAIPIIICGPKTKNPIQKKQPAKNHK
ncbi:Uncharacterised protein [Vibrio cholerae]|nr:Uncharacterised protein [Vibrio cholerae]